MNDWKEYRLGDYIEKLGSGATPRGGKESYINDGISLIRSQNVLDFEFTKEGLAFINDEQARKLNNVIVQENDILINITGDSVARVCSVPKNILPARVNQHVSIIRPKIEFLDSSFLKYYLLNPNFKAHLLSLASSGGTRNALTKLMLEDLAVIAPKITEQRAIAEILSSLDDKIELNNRINKNLEELAQAIFKRWFIEFEFPYDFEKGDLDLNGKPYKSSGGEFVDSELGLIPKEWRIIGLLEFAQLHSGGTPKTEIAEYWEGDIKWISAKDVTPNNGRFIIETERNITNKGLENSNANFIPEYSTIVTARGTVGKLCIIPEPMTISQSNYALSPKDKFSYFYLFVLLKSLISEMKQKSYGTVFDTITTNSLSEIRISLPERRLLESFRNIINPLMHNCLINRKQNKSLEILRNTILPKLISGELRVNDVE